MWNPLGVVRLCVFVVSPVFEHTAECCRLRGGYSVCGFHPNFRDLSRLGSALAVSMAMCVQYQKISLVCVDTCVHVGRVHRQASMSTVLSESAVVCPW